jgi:hypothetical protein
MRLRRPVTRAASRLLVLAACAAVAAAAIGSDAAEARATHSLVLVLVAVTVLAARLWSTRHHGGGLLLPLAVGVLVQPAVHLLGKVSHQAGAGPGAAGHAGAGDLSLAGGQLMMAAAVALAVTLGERLAAGLVLVLWICWRLLALYVPVLDRRQPRPPAPALRGPARLCAHEATRYRGPPAGRAA